MNINNGKSDKQRLVQHVVMSFFIFIILNSKHGKHRLVAEKYRLWEDKRLSCSILPMQFNPALIRYRRFGLSQS